VRRSAGEDVDGCYGGRWDEVMGCGDMNICRNIILSKRERLPVAIHSQNQLDEMVTDIDKIYLAIKQLCTRSLCM
jgi:hypothetical protein